MKLDIKNQMSIWQNIVNRLLWIHLAVMALATASFISSWRYIYDMAKQYGKIHESRRRVNIINISILMKTISKLGKMKMIVLNLLIK